MNRFFPALVIFCVILSFSCGKRALPATEYKEGLTIDSTIREKVMENNKAKELLLSELEVRMFENDKPNNKTIMTGTDVPHNSYSRFNKDTLSILITNSLGGSYGLKIEKTKDSCRVFYGFSIRDTKGIFKLNSTDTGYAPGLMVPCRYTLALNKNEYAAGETVYGFIKCASEDYFAKGKKGDVKLRVTYEGYFKALVLDGE